MATRPNMRTLQMQDSIDRMTRLIEAMGGALTVVATGIEHDEARNAARIHGGAVHVHAVEAALKDYRAWRVLCGKPV